MTGTSTIHGFSFNIEEEEHANVLLYIIRCKQLGQHWSFTARDAGEVQAFLCGFDLGRRGTAA